MEVNVPTTGDGLLSCTGDKQPRLSITCENVDDMMGEHPTKFKAKRERTRQGLLATLPPLDQVQRIFASNGDWWHTWRRKCSGTSDPEQTLADFASRALADGNIGAIGTVVLSVGICCADEDDVEKYIEAVDRYVLCDDEYAATLEGMECLILKSKWYADVGQPRRAWISYRKGLMYAQLMVCLSCVISLFQC
jgi:alkanesulfonate monooxygenase SsuD/methylene tetrahydromethanopterin reductase-like flavin-dependent oxidoreductase (luciferase family)